MRVQRAPRSAEQPQRPPVGYEARRQPRAVADRSATTRFSAEIDLDLTRLLKRLDESQVAAEIVAGLLLACRREGLIDAGSAVRLVNPTDDGLVGITLDRGANLSAYAIWSGLATSAADLPHAEPGMLTVVHAAGRSRVTGDWGLGGLAVATVGPIVPTLVSYPEPTGPGRAIAQRQLARLALVVEDGARHGPGTARALEAVARLVEDGPL